MERKILKTLANREYYGQLRAAIEANEFSPHGQLLLNAIDAYFERDAGATGADFELLGRSLGESVSDKHRDAVLAVVKAVAEEEVSEPNVCNLVLTFRRERLGRDLGARLLNTGKADKKEIDKLINEYIELDEKIKGIIEEKNEVMNGASIESLVQILDEGNRIPLYPRSLNEMLGGGALRGQNVVIYGRPEVGKTLFLVNLISGFLSKGLRVFYAGNEDPITAVAPRIVSRLVGMDVPTIRRKTKEAQELAEARGYTNLYMKDITPGSWRELRKDIDDIEPDVVVVDQLRHLYCGPLTKVEQMEQATIGARNVAKEYNLLSVGTTQAGDSADGKLVLEMGDIDFSNTGMQGAVDLLIGIGNNDGFDRAGRRMLSFPKNKISGKHDYFPVVYNIPINKVETL